jgi:hypothetical protein
VALMVRVIRHCDDSPIDRIYLSGSTFSELNFLDMFYLAETYSFQNHPHCAK